MRLFECFAAIGLVNHMAYVAVIKATAYENARAATTTGLPVDQKVVAAAFALMSRLLKHRFRGSGKRFFHNAGKPLWGKECDAGSWALWSKP